MEKELAISFLYPILLSPEYSNSFGDQFAFNQSVNQSIKDKFDIRINTTKQLWINLNKVCSFNKNKTIM